MTYSNPVINKLISSKKYELAIIPSLQIVGDLMVNSLPKPSSLAYIVEHPIIETEFLVPTRVNNTFLDKKLDVELIVKSESLPDIDYNIANSLSCEYCEGHGWWPDSSTPLHKGELTWVYASPCKFCSSHNHFEYEEMCGVTNTELDNHWHTLTIASKGFYKALDNMRSETCVES